MTAERRPDLVDMEVLVDEDHRDIRRVGGILAGLPRKRVSEMEKPIYFAEEVLTFSQQGRVGQT